MKQWSNSNDQPVGTTILEELAIYEGLFNGKHKQEFASRSFVAGALSAILLVIKAMAGEDANDPGPQKLTEIHDQLEAWHNQHSQYDT